MPGIAGKRALVKVTGDPVAFVDEACSTTNNMTYTIVAATKKYWDRDAAITVEDTGVPVNPAVDPYTINRLTGQVIFETVDALRGPITVSGSYLPTSVAAGARSYSFSLEAASVDDSEFDTAGTHGFTEKLQGLKDVSGTIGRRFRVSSPFAEILIAGAPVILEFYVDRATAPDLVVWALLSKEGLQAAIDGAQDTDCDWQGAPDAEGRVIAEAA